MAVAPTFPFAPALKAWFAAFDEGFSRIPVVGPLLAPRWRVCRVDAGQLQTGTVDIKSSSGGRPVVARLAADLGVQTQVPLPRAARGDLMSAARLALEASSPIAPGYSRMAIDLGSARTEGANVVVTAHVAHRDAVDAAADLVRRFAGRLDAVDIENPDFPAASPPVDLRTGHPAVRGGLSPAAVLAATSAAILLVGVVGIGAAAWRNNASDGSAPASPAVRAAGTLASQRKSDPPILDTVQALSSALPTSAYLETLEIAGGSVRILGRASDASRLPAALEIHPDLAGAAFSGPTRGVPDGRQSFEITLARTPRSAPR